MSEFMSGERCSYFSGSLMPTDPNTALLFFAAGLLGIYAEFCFPGIVLPGVAGGVLFLLSIAGFVEMGARWSGALLMLAGFALLAADALFHRRWMLAAAGVILIVAGAIRLHEGMRPLLAASVAGPLAVITVLLLSIAVRASENKKQKVGVVFWHADDIFSSVGDAPHGRSGPRAGGHG
jgi:membrane-bound ClpP family serine protease